MAQQKTTKAAPAFGVDAETAKRLLHQMMLIRRFEEKAAEAYALGKIGGFLHLSIGEEAVGAGATSALRPADYAISTYPQHRHPPLKRPHPRPAVGRPVRPGHRVRKGEGGS